MVEASLERATESGLTRDARGRSRVDADILRGSSLYRMLAVLNYLCVCCCRLYESITSAKEDLFRRMASRVSIGD
jgi:hypothetical protein